MVAIFAFFAAMHLLSVTSLLFGTLASASVRSKVHVLHEKREVPFTDSVDRQRIEGNAILPIRIGLKANEDATRMAESWLMAVSHPESADYGHHWNQDDVIKAFEPNLNTVTTVRRWLAEHGIVNSTHSANKQWIAFDTTAARAEEIFRADYFEHQHSSGRTLASTDSYHLPADVSAVVDFITPGVKASDVTGRTRRSRLRRRAEVDNPDVRKRAFGKGFPFPPDPTDLSRCGQMTSPACIRALYGIPELDPSQSVNPNNSLGIFSIYSQWYQGNLNDFFEAFTDIPSGTSPLWKSVDGGAPPPTDLNGAGLNFVDGEANLDLQTSMPIVYPQNVTVWQVDDSYWALWTYSKPWAGIMNTFLDAIDGSYCTYCSNGECGNNPHNDPVYPDTKHTDGYQGELQCGVYTPPNVLSVSYGAQEDWLPAYYLRRQCNEFLKLGLQGITAVISSDDWGVGLCAKHERVFVPDVPAGCPWVLSVGATQIGRNKTVDDVEEAVNHEDAGFLSGGGFSIVHDAPAYQQDAIARYFAISNTSLPYFFNGSYNHTDGVYNRNGRGVPDVSAIGNNIPIFNGKQRWMTGGTSASAPIFAAMLNRIVEERLRAGKAPLGFINPVLYNNPQVFNDIVVGDNIHPGKWCRGKGFKCAPGWDPITGLGTPKYQELLDLFMRL